VLSNDNPTSPAVVHHIRVRTFESRAAADRVATQLDSLGNVQIEDRPTGSVLLLGSYPSREVALAEAQRLIEEEGLLIEELEPSLAGAVHVVLGAVATREELDALREFVAAEGFFGDVAFRDEKGWQLAWAVPTESAAQAMRQSLLECGLVATFRPLESPLASLTLRRRNQPLTLASQQTVDR
jgi:hypothetical protein